MKALFFRFYLVVFIIPVINSNLFSQTIKEQLENLKIKLTDLREIQRKYEEDFKLRRFEILNDLNAFKIELSILSESISKEKNKLDEISRHRKSSLTEIQNLFDTIQKLNKDNQIEYIKVKNSWKIDTLVASAKSSECYDLIPNYLKIKSAPIKNLLVSKVNLELEKFCFEFPILLNEEKNNIPNDCEDWNNYNLCNKPWSISNSIESIDTVLYLSVLQMVQFEFCGATWVFRGFNSINFDLKSGTEISLNENQHSKKILLDEIKHHFDQLNKKNDYFVSPSGNHYIKFDELSKKISIIPFNELTFYFKDGILMLLYYYYNDRWSNQTLIIPLPKLQKYLNL